MNIQNIQIAQGVLNTIEERFNSRKENVSPNNETSLPQNNMPESDTISPKAAESIKASTGENLMEVVYPPFFPLGNTQDILSIEGVKLAGEEMKSASAVSVKDKGANGQKEAGAGTTNAVGNTIRQSDIAPALDSPAENNTPQIKHETNPGDVLDLKI